MFIRYLISQYIGLVLMCITIILYNIQIYRKLLLDLGMVLFFILILGLGKYLN
jgi:hypothetical protein